MGVTAPTTPALRATPPCQGGEQDCRTVGASLAGGASLALSRTSPRREAAWKLLEFLAESEQQARFYQLTGDLPARQSAWTDPALAGNRYAQAFRRQLQHVRATPAIPEWERIASKLAYHAERAIRRQVSVDEALAALDRDVDRILEKRRWLLSREGSPSPANEGSAR